MKNLLFITVLFCAISAQAQTINIPDVNFELALIEQGIDSNGLTGNILISDAEAATLLNLEHDGNSGWSPISNIAGIEAFVNLIELKLSSNDITTLDLSNNLALELFWDSSSSLESIDLDQNIALKDLNIYMCQLTTLNVAQNTNLKDISVVGNMIEGALDFSQNLAAVTIQVAVNPLLTSVDVSGCSNLVLLNAKDVALSELNVTQNPNLGFLFAQNNNLSDLNISQNPYLKTLKVGDNNLTSLDISQNLNMETLEISGNKFTSFDATTMPNLKTLAFEDMQVGFKLTSLNVRGLTNLTKISIGDNDLTSLDLSTNTALELVSVFNNPNLSELDIKNGNNVNLITLEARDNPSLLCIQVDEEIIGNIPAGWEKDATASYSSDCAYVGIDDVMYEDMISIYPNPVSHVLHINLPQNLRLDSIKVFDVSGKRIFSSTETATTIDFSPFQAGVYFVELSCNNERIFKKVVKQ